MNLRLQTESWIWYTIAVGMVVARLLSRKLLLRSFRHLQYDDWIMGLFVIPSYTALIVCANIQYKKGTNLLPPGYDFSYVTSDEIARRIYGSKMVVVVEQMQVAVIWACKACLLIMYQRLTETCAPKSYVAIKFLAAYVALGFVIMEILYFAAWCRPFSDYWAVPPSSSQCNALIDHRITNAVFNISSDLIMLFIAIPLFLRSLLPLKRKLILCGIFGLGIFVILAAVLNKYYSFSKPYQSDWVFWYVRESSTAILVANVPFTWTLLREMFDVGEFEQNPEPWTFHTSRTAGGRSHQRTVHHTRTISSNDHHTSTYRTGSKFSGDKPLVGSITIPKEDLERFGISEKSQDSSNGSHDCNGLFEEVHPHDFMTVTGAEAVDVDLERGEAHLEGESDSEMAMYRAALRSTSPTPSHSHHPPHSPTKPAPTNRNSGTHSKPDGTGGYLRSPRAAHLASSGTHSRTHSRASSISSLHRRPISPPPTYLSASTFDDGPSPFITTTFGDGAGTTHHKKRSSSPARPPSIATTMGSASSGGGHAGAGGGGRSAVDRKKRLRTST